MMITENLVYNGDPSKLPIKHDHLQVVIGDGLDGQQVSAALQGHDAILCSVGGSGLGETTLMSTVTKNLIEGMKEHGIDRIVYCASAGIHKELKGISGKMVTYVLRKVLVDHNRSYELLRDSQLRWTVARPMGLTSGTLVGSYLEFPNGEAPSGQKIARADVAQFMLKAVQDD